MKAIIPVAGAGTNLRPLTYTQHKALIPLAGKPLLGHIIDQLKEAGIKEFIFVIGYLGEKIKEYVEKNHKDIICHFVEQKKRLGTGHAIGLTQDLVENDEIIITLGDTICEYDVTKILKSTGNLIGIYKVQDPTKFGIVKIDKEDSITDFTEKPKIPKSNYAIVGVYKISDSYNFFKALSNIEKEDQENSQELSITMVLQKMLENNISFQTFTVNRWFDCGRKETLLETNKILLQKLFGNKHNEDKNDNIILEPVFIDNNCTIKNSIIGPNVSIGENSMIKNSIISNSIVGSFSELNLMVLENSLVGSDVKIDGNKHQLNIGDNTEIDLSL